LVKEAAKTIENKGLLLIHCRAGIGRTGTFGATIEATRLLQKIKMISLFEVAVQMRLYRLYCI
jgi:protein tyrosine phosphatase